MKEVLEWRQGVIGLEAACIGRLGDAPLLTGEGASIVKAATDAIAKAV